METKFLGDIIIILGLITAVVFVIPASESPCHNRILRSKRIEEEVNPHV